MQVNCSAISVCTLKFYRYRTVHNVISFKLVSVMFVKFSNHCFWMAPLDLHPIESDCKADECHPKLLWELRDKFEETG